jgi:hypothetical protein
VIASLHVATGALAGDAAGSRARAVALAPLLHLALDVIPHEDVASHRFELATAGSAIVALALVRGPLHPATIGGLLPAAPDVEHLASFPRPGNRKLFPSHWFSARHRGPRIPVVAQLFAAGALLAVVVRRR